MVPPFGAVPPSDIFSKDTLVGFETVVPISANPAPRLFGDADMVLEENPSNLYVGLVEIDVVSILAKLKAETCHENVPLVSTSFATIVKELLFLPVPDEFMVSWEGFVCDVLVDKEGAESINWLLDIEN